MATQRSRRVTLPGADELFFRPSDSTEPEAQPETEPAHAVGVRDVPEEEPVPVASPGVTSGERTVGSRRQGSPNPSGRQRHDEKITVYISAAELLALEQTRLALRAEHGLTADRGRVVREAVAVLLADFEEHGDSSMIVQRLAGD